MTAVVRYSHHMDLDGNRIGSLGTPTSATEAATKGYVDGFTPTVSGDWSPAPTTLAAALNQLAARVKALEDAAP